MNSKILNAGALSSLTIEGIHLYLKSKHWQMRDAIEGRSTLWTHGLEETELLVPELRTFLDFERRICELLFALEKIEKRPYPAILSDLLLVGFDTIKVRRDEEDTKNGTISFPGGIRLVAGIKEILTDSARGLIRMLSSEDRSHADSLNGVLTRFRLGQTEIGSYVATVVTNVMPPSLTGDRTRDAFAEETPVQRLVVYRLNRAIAAAMSSAEKGEMKSFRDSLLQGVTSKLCNALANLGDNDDAGSKVEISFKLSPAQTFTKDVIEKVTIPVEAREVLEDASHYLKSIIPAPADKSFTALGPVVVLQREKFATEGKVIVVTEIEGRQRKVTVELKAKSYEHALHAHDQNFDISIRGKLVQEGKVWKLEDPRKLRVIDPNDQMDLDLKVQDE